MPQMGMIEIGPLALPIAPLLLAAALLVSLWVGQRGNAPRQALEAALYNILLAAVVAARGAFILVYWDTFRQAPLTMLDIRDGGFFPLAGVLAGAALAARYAWRRPDLRHGLLRSLLAGAAVAAVGGMAAFALRPARTELVLRDAMLRTLDGNPVRLDAFRGRPVVVNLWASWCPPCRREMPMLEQAQARNPGVAFLFVNQGESAAEVRQYLADERIALRNVMLDPGMEVAHQVASRALPTTLFLDAGGRLQSLRMGQLSAASLTQQLKSALPPAAH